MQHLLEVTNSDQLNRYGTRFSVTALVSDLWDTYNVGVPMLLGHDFLRAIGWSYPLAVHFESGLTRLTEIGVLAETTEESEQLSQALQSYLVKAAQPYQQEIEQLQQLLTPYVMGSEKILAGKECVALIEEGLCERTFPNLFENADKDGLILLEQLNPIGPGVYKIGDLAVFAHHFFRRSLARMNTLNTPFLSRLQQASVNAPTIKVAIDRDMVGLAATYREYKEFAYWWGPKFDDNLISIPRGVTHHEATEIDRIFHGISSTQFWWQSRDNQHIFEAEELRDIPVRINDDIKYGCRYVHSIVDVPTNNVFHLDGAVRSYSEDSMIERLDTDIIHAGRHTEYTKLWRIDGQVPVNLWKSLLSDYFRDNCLVGEYLGAQPEQYEISSEQEMIEDSLLMKYVPYSMQKGDGLQIALSFHSYESISSAEIQVIPLDVLSYDDKQQNYIESWAIELSKAISRVGGSLDIPENTILVSFKDSYINFPFISHGEIETLTNIQRTVNGIRLLVEAFNAKDYDLVISYTLGVPIEGKEARISVLGHVADIGEWLSTSLCVPPVTTLDAIEKWGENTSSYLKKKYQENTSKIPLFEILMTSGILLIKRKQIESKFSPQYEIINDKVIFGLRIPDEENNLKDAIDKNEIFPARSFMKLASLCTHCNQNYQDCGCLKIVDNGVAEEITEIRTMPLFWTDRPV